MRKLFPYIQRYKAVLLTALISLILSIGGVFVLYHVLQNQKADDNATQRASERAYDAQVDAYTAALTLRRAQVDACERGNDVRMELNERVTIQQTQRNILLRALERAAVASDNSRSQFAALRDELRALNYAPIPILNCEGIVPKIKLSPPVPPGGVATPAHPSNTTASRAMKVKHVLARHYGPVCNTTVYRIPVVRVAGLRWKGQKVDGLAVMNRYPDPTRCIIYIERNKRIPTETLCILHAHELGHFVRGPKHSSRQGSLMHRDRPDYWGPCSRRFG